MNKASASDLREIAIKGGMKTLWQDGLDKLSAGLTTADEIARALLGTEDEVDDAAPAQANPTHITPAQLTSTPAAS